jgi:ankyrin repeat protein
MASRTGLLNAVKHFRWRAVRDALHESPSLLAYRDNRRRNWLHLCCSVNVKKNKRTVANSVRTADVLLRAGLDVNEPAFREGDDFQATPLWFAIAFGENLPLAHYLLHEGSTPEYCLWAAVNRDSPESIRLLLAHGATIPQNPDASLLLAAVFWNKFVAAKELIRIGLDVNFRDDKGMTALHHLLRKDADPKHIRMFINAGARGDIRNKKGDTAIAILRRKRDRQYHRMADLLEQQ